MGTSILVRIAENKYYQLILMGVLSLLTTAGLANFSNGRFWTLWMSMLLVINMCIEDWKTGLIDLRKAFVLFIGLLLCSYHSSISFIFTYALAFFAWQLFYFLNTVVKNIGNGGQADKEKTGNVVESIMKTRTPYLPFLLSGIVLAMILITLFADRFRGYLYGRTIDDFLVAALGIYGVGTVIIILLLILMILKKICCVWLRHRQKKGYTVQAAGIGMGDIVILPIFLTFLGDIFFLVTILMSAISAAIYLSLKKYWMKSKEVNF